MGLDIEHIRTISPQPPLLQNTILVVTISLN